MKFPSGFVPVDYQLLGKAFLVLGFIVLLVKGVDYLTGWLALPNLAWGLGVTYILISLYLLFVVPKPE